MMMLMPLLLLLILSIVRYRQQQQQQKSIHIADEAEYQMSCLRPRKNMMSEPRLNKNNHMSREMVVMIIMREGGKDEKNKAKSSIKCLYSSIDNGQIFVLTSHLRLTFLGPTTEAWVNCTRPADERRSRICLRASSAVLPPGSPPPPAPVDEVQTGLDTGEGGERPSSFLALMVTT